VIRLEGLRRVFGSHVAVDGLDLSIAKGEVFGLLGPNGAGKSTTLKVCAGLLRPSAGSVRIEGVDVSEDPLGIKRRVGYVPEDGVLYEPLTVTEYLRLVCELRAMSPELSDARILRLLETFQLEDRRDARIASLSRGMKQKVLIAQSLVHEPPVVLLDEPLTGLDPRSARRLKDLLLELAERGTTVVYSSHVLDVVERVCTRIAILHRGRLRAEGGPAELMARAETTSLEDAFLHFTADGEESVGDRDGLPPGRIRRGGR
jgi:ABC-2 type transport system ATP-binding protein